MIQVPGVSRVVLVTVLAVLCLAGGGPAWAAWWSAVEGKRVAGGGGAGTGGSSFELVTALATAAGSACPGGGPILVVSDDPIAWLRGNYVLYPRKLDVVQSVDGFTAADLDAHSGGCLLTFGPQRSRIEPYRPRLLQAACTGDDCVYRVADAPPR